MTLPLGAVVRLPDKHFGPMKEAMASLKTLNDGLKKLSSTFFWTEEAKQMLLNPRNGLEIECQKLKLNIDDSQPTKYFVCENVESCTESKYRVYVSTSNVARCRCGRFMNGAVSLQPSDVQAASDKEGVFASGSASFIIGDDLRVMPNLLGLSVELLNILGIKDTSALEERTSNLGLKEIISLLMWSIVSQTPLSEVILHNKPFKSELFCSALFQTSKDTKETYRKIVVKIMVHKSTKKLLFVQAGEDFMDFLFSLPAIPLGQVVSLLCANTSLGSIINLWKSISSLDADKYLKSKELGDMLIRPKFPPCFSSKNKIFEISEKSHQLYYNEFSENNKFQHFLSHQDHSYTLPLNWTYSVRPVAYKDPTCKWGFVRGPAMFMVTDDVTLLSSISTIFFLNRLGISLSNVEELDLKIGTEEFWSLSLSLRALGILRASIISSSALTNGLNLMSKIQLKQEK